VTIDNTLSNEATAGSRGQPAGWQFWIDRGGTFTDIVAISPSGILLTKKLLSEAPGRYGDAAVSGIDQLIAEHPDEAQRIAAVRMGTTIGTNALLERSGSSTVFVTSVGFGDVLRIGTQQRPDLFTLNIRLPSMLYERVVEASERVGADGTVVLDLDEKGLERALRNAWAQGQRSAAIAFLHGYRYPDHERRAAAVARDIGFKTVSVSHEVNPRIKLVERGTTTVADAYLTPVIESYVASLRANLDQRQNQVPLLFMQSHGGLVEANQFRGHNSILSGPAGGVVGMVKSGEIAGYSRVIGFDMGGTSTDVSLYAGVYERTDSTSIAGTVIAAPMMRIDTVAAGGGSILSYASGRLRVGPESAGADPGPACYRNGGPATLTDANLFLGRIQPDFFPRVFGNRGTERIDATAAERRIEALTLDIRRGGQKLLSATEVAAGYLAIAIDHMAGAIKRVSIQRGHATREFALSCFGGAGGQHACLVAEAIGIVRVIVDPLAGVLSAYGIGVADLRTIRTAPIERTLDESVATQLSAVAERLTKELLAARDVATVGHASIALASFRIERRCQLRVANTDSVFAISFELGATHETILNEFRRAYRDRFGFEPPQAEVTAMSVDVESIVALEAPARPRLDTAVGPPVPVTVRRAWISGSWRQVPIYQRSSLAAGSRVDGPSIIVEANGTTIVESAWHAEVTAAGFLILLRADRQALDEHRPSGIGSDPDPIMLEVFNNQFMHIAEQMGAVLEQTAESVNIRERLDYSCALFDSSGALIANAPHVPIHLGSMSESVRAVLNSAYEMRSGDAFIINAPYSGGTHLPDITVVSPVISGSGSVPQYIVASRAHHADIGGLTPGSMPAHSTTIDQEGVLFECMRIVRDGELLEAPIRQHLAEGPYPARNPNQNIADLTAQLAANAKGILELSRLIEQYGESSVSAYTGFVKDNAEECIRDAITRLVDGSCSLDLDGGEHIYVSLRIDRAQRSATVDFTGTGPASATNFNAPSSIARAVVLYVFRCLIDQDIPLNEGCLVPINIILPAGSLLDPNPPAAVVAGNVETSQCIADALLAAVGAAAASQGTMNNFTFGDAVHQYYETICGGCGAGPGFDGASAVHSHMTNSRLTDPEVLEQRFPVRLKRFLIRRGSGGKGRWRGGDGVIRELEFLGPMTGSILSNRRTTVAFGLNGGGPGLAGKNYVLRASGYREDYGAAAQLQFMPGDRFVIETPGGGGFGH
jgi:5-oxoprolinase (ATP-hydrolysing)